MRVTFRVKNGTRADLAAAVRSTRRRSRRAESWVGPRQTHSLIGASIGQATRVLVTSRERGWRAPSGQRAAGKPNTYVRTALAMGRDSSADLTAESENPTDRGKWSAVYQDGPSAGLTVEGRARRYA